MNCFWFENKHNDLLTINDITTTIHLHENTFCIALETRTHILEFLPKKENP